jgi:beta-xylosidase
MLIVKVSGMTNRVFIVLIFCYSVLYAQAQQPYVSKVWVADNKDGTYKNPVLFADYSDPDVCRVGDDYYLVSSSFNCIPGLPILHSRDLVNWRMAGYALQQQPPLHVFDKPQHGNGVWAPAIRYHNNEFYIYYPDPDFGIYMVKAKQVTGPWSEPVLVEGGKGLIDPCPFWDDDGKVYLAHAYAGSRAGIKSIVVIKTMNAAGTKVTDGGVLVFDGHNQDPTLEGPKLYKRNGYYYIFAPAGGVATGWQLVLRSKNIYGPYERKVVMDQGSTPVNGPHQGAWVDTKTGEDWFLHFQDRGAYGRIVHLQPMKWINNWPVIGIDKDGDGKGEPVLQYKKPNVGKTYPVQTPVESDEFDGHQLGLQWQWHANAKPYWAFPSAGKLRLFSWQVPDSARSLWDVPNLLMQKFPADEFTATVKLDFKPRLDGERLGLLVMGYDYAGIVLTKKADGIYLSYITCKQADKGSREQEQELGKISATTTWLQVKVTREAKCQLAYSSDGNRFTDAGTVFTALPGRWIGAKVGLFCTRTTKTNDSGFGDIDWFRFD